jgi:GH15 family glucan-1,4-alpha-glucosidase
MLQWGYDTYCYVWPRDAAYAAMALDQAGDTNVAKRFFEFCRDTVTDDGYFMHKYLPDKSLGSSWHPWVGESGIQLPIQEDETAIVVYALSRHFAQSHDLEFLEAMFEPLVERTADFMLQYRDPDTHLPLESYELWERKRGTSTYTASAVYAALIAAAELSRVLGKSTHETRYREGAREVRDAILAHLWDEKSGLFLNMTQHHGGVVVRDPTVDVSSVYGVFFFNVLSPDDPKLVKAWDNTVRALSHGVSAGGLARFEQDDYFRIEGEAAGNPWIITTLWYAEYLIARAKTDGDLARVRDIFNWVLRHAQVSGVLSEQLNPYTGEQFSSTPLAWSHATYVTTVLAYLERLERLGITAPDSHR